jgi:hypothetical protein
LIRISNWELESSSSFSFQDERFKKLFDTVLFKKTKNKIIKPKGTKKLIGGDLKFVFKNKEIELTGYRNVQHINNKLVSKFFNDDGGFFIFNPVNKDIKGKYIFDINFVNKNTKTLRSIHGSFEITKLCDNYILEFEKLNDNKMKSTLMECKN